VRARPDAGGQGDAAPPTAAGPVVGYYPVAGWPAGTVQAWDGESWQQPVTVPGFYRQADGELGWWNGHSWVAGVPVPHAAGTDLAPTRPALQPRPRRAHARRHRRTRPLHSAAAALATITALAATGRR